MKKTLIAGVLIGSLFFTTEAHAADYKVQSGDSLWKISQKFKTNVNTIKKLNNLKSNTIYSGQKLKISEEKTTKKQAVASVHNVPILKISDKATSILESGQKYLGARYLLGASTSRTDVFDCSSFTQRLFKENGINLPRSSRDQANIGKSIPLSSVRAGDLIFYDTDFNGVINHVAVAVNNNTIMHASTSKGTTVEKSHAYWNNRVVKAVRVIN